jgi:hypothetical protein
MRKAVKIAAWIVGVLVGIPVAAYVAAIVVNWRDRAPSPEALQLTASYQSRAAVAEADNAFIYFLGFNSALGESPSDVGARRLEWLQQYDAPADAADDPLVAPLDYLGADSVVAEFRAACDKVNSECLGVYTNAGEVFERWSATQPWLLERYRRLIAHGGWREHVPSNLAVPLPSYSAVLHGQRLLLLQATTLAEAGDSAAVADLLAGDLRFWRMVLESSDLLITKMIATAALQRHFEWGNLALRGLSANAALAATPAEWRTPLTATELSLRRALAGEWIHVSGTLTQALAEHANAESLPERASNRLFMTLFQRQDTLNRYSTYFTQLGATLDAPLLDYETAADAASMLAERTAAETFPPRSLYNITGALLIAAGPADYGDYARRVADLEGIRRAALATVELRAEGAASSSLPSALAASSLRNPYDDQPLQWDAGDRAVVFVGLEPGERGAHRFYY